MNTREKRASALGRGLPFLAVFPLPDGTINTADRVQIAWLYRAFFEVFPVVAPEFIFAVLAQERAFFVNAQERVFSVQQQVRSFLARRPQ